MRHQLPASILTTLVAATLLPGCGLSDPYAGTPASTSTATTQSPTGADADPAPERGGAIPTGARTAQTRLRSDAAQPTPQAALERYARRYLNWTAATLTPIQRELAAGSLGQARAQALQAAASAARDRTLTQSGVANHGRLVAITHSLTTAGGWVLVSAEQTTGTGDYAGLPPTLHVIYAQVTRTPAGWVVSQWAPQN